MFRQVKNENINKHAKKSFFQKKLSAIFVIILDIGFKYTSSSFQTTSCIVDGFTVVRIYAISTDQTIFDVAGFLDKISHLHTG